MAGLPNNTFAAPGVSFYATAGGGAASTLQSPVAIIPDVNADAQLIAQGIGNGDGSLQARVDGAGFGTASVLVGANTVYAMSVTAQAGPGGNVLAIGENGAAAAAILYDAATGGMEIGDGGAGGIRMNNAIAVYDRSIDPTEGNGVYIAPTSATSAVIENNIASSGTLSLGSSTSINQLVLSDTGAGTGQVAVGGNGGTKLVAIGGVSPDPTGVGANLRTDAASSGVLTIGSSVANPTTLFVKDTGAAGTGFVDVAGGVYNSIALRLQGANSQVGANQAKISTNNVDAQSPILNISNSVDGTPKIIIDSVGTTINGSSNTITGDTTFTSGNCIVKSVLSFGQTGGFNTGGANVGAIEAPNIYTSFSVAVSSGTTVPIPQPTGTGGVPMEIGLYLVLTNGTIGGVPSASCYISSHAYWNGTIWSVGGGGAAPALVSPPPSYCGIQANGGGNLILANGSGLGVATINVYFIQLYGYLGL